MHKYYLFATVATLTVLITLGILYSKGVNPTEKRARLLDDQRTQGFNSIYAHIYYNYTPDKPIPDSLGKIDLAPQIKTDPESKNLYDYKRLSDNSYEICATFSTDTRTSNDNINISPYRDDPYGLAYNHPKGYHCVTYTIDKTEEEIYLNKVPVKPDSSPMPLPEPIQQRDTTRTI